jgi:hypothetical protein
MLQLIPAIAVLCFAPTLASEQRNGAERLREIRAIYVADLGQTEKAKTLRTEIINELARSNRITVVETPAEADAVLSLSIKHGTRNVDHTYEEFGQPGLKTNSIVVATQELVFRLDSREKRTLWSAKFDAGSSAYPSGTKAARSLANKVSRKFQQAVEKDRKLHP